MINMSHNLTLSDGDKVFELYQTPTSVTRLALKTDAKVVYFKWLSTLGTEEEHWHANIDEHKTALEMWIKTNPNAKWGCT